MKRYLVKAVDLPHDSPIRPNERIYQIYDTVNKTLGFGGSTDKAKMEAIAERKNKGIK